jgi:hypothetical protein
MSALGLDDKSAFGSDDKSGIGSEDKSATGVDDKKAWRDKLFSNFEVNKTPRWPIMAKLVGGSVVFHLIWVACVVFVPPVRDAVNVAAMFSGLHYVDQDYEKTKIRDATIIELPHDKFHYPEGYFAMVTPDGFVMPEPTSMAIPLPTPPPAQIISTFKPPRMPRSPRIRPLQGTDPNEEASASPSPSPSPSASPETAKTTEEKKIEEQKAKDAEAKKEAEKKMDEIAKANGIDRPKDDEINKKPLKDLVVRAKEMKDKGELDLSGSIDMTLEADLKEDGKLDNAVVTHETGDPKLKAVATQFASALSDSHVLRIFKGTGHLLLTLKLDQSNVAITMSTELASPEEARRLANAYNLLLAGGVISKKGQDEEVYFRSTKVKYNDKKIIVDFSMPRDKVAQMLTKYAAELPPKG